MCKESIKTVIKQKFINQTSGFFLRNQKSKGYILKVLLFTKLKMDTLNDISLIKQTMF